MKEALTAQTPRGPLDDALGTAVLAPVWSRASGIAFLRSCRNPRPASPSPPAFPSSWSTVQCSPSLCGFRYLFTFALSVGARWLRVNRPVCHQTLRGPWVHPRCTLQLPRLCCAPPVPETRGSPGPRAGGAGITRPTTLPLAPLGNHGPALPSAQYLETSSMCFSKRPSI